MYLNYWNIVPFSGTFASLQGRTAKYQQNFRDFREGPLQLSRVKKEFAKFSTRDAKNKGHARDVFFDISNRDLILKSFSFFQVHLSPVHL